MKNLTLWTKIVLIWLLISTFGLLLYDHFYKFNPIDKKVDMIYLNQLHIVEGLNNAIIRLDSNCIYTKKRADTALIISRSIKLYGEK